MSVKVVIGVGYGDEGKGVTVNYLSTPDTTVVRFNGGSQAGHTVVHNGIRHVFSHFGSGTLKGAKTHLSRFFVANPPAFNVEFDHLKSVGINPKVSISSQVLVTTPYDIWINQKLEHNRTNKHGSVGVGFGETVGRNESHYYRLNVLDVKNAHKQPPWRISKLYTIKNQWFPLRCQQLGIDLSKSDVVKLDDYYDYCINVEYPKFLDRVNIIDDPVIMSRKNLVCEGAQGLMLDPEYGTMPYCTRSSCGLKNVVKLLKDKHLEVYYISRPYTTRHGRGPLAFEDKNMSFIDQTNRPNEFQESLRFAPINLDLINRVMHSDLTKYRNGTIGHIGVMTCLDQMSNTIPIVLNNEVRTVKQAELVSLYTKMFHNRIILTNVS